MSNPASLPRVHHTRFVKTPVITDTLHLQSYQRGQWVVLAWCAPHKSRYYGMNPRGNVTAFHYPRAAARFAEYCGAGRRHSAVAA